MGVVFKGTVTQQTFIRVKKLAFKVNYLMQFFELDPETGLFMDKYNSNQFGAGKANNSASALLRQMTALHSEHLVDLNALYLRHLAPRNSKNKLDSRFQIFCEISEADIEITECSKVIDFTRCSYSILHQDRVHVLIENSNGQQEVRQFKVVESLPMVQEDSVEDAPKQIQLQLENSVLLSAETKFDKIA